MCAVAILAKVSEKDFDKKKRLNIKTTNRLVQHLKDDSDVVRQYSKLDKVPLPIHVYQTQLLLQFTTILLHLITVFS